MNISAVSMVNSFAGKKYPSHYEKGPNGEMGVWTRNGGNYAFFTPASVLEAQKQPVSPTPHKKGKEETPEEYYQRKLYSPEWIG